MSQSHSVSETRHSRRHRRLRPQFILGVLALLLVTAGLAVFLVLYNARVYTRVTVEAGDLALSPEDFSKNGSPVEFAPGFDPASVDSHTPGDYDVKLVSGIFRYTAKLTVRDTTPPAGSPRPCMISRGEKCRPEDLVTDARDETEISFRFESEPDTSVCGKKEVAVILTDLGGNETRVSAPLTVMPLYSVLSRETGEAAPAPESFVLPGETVTELVTLNEAMEAAEVDFAALAAKPGEHPVYFRADGLDCVCTLRVIDTTPPVLTLRDAVFCVGAKVLAEYFVEKAQDADDMTFTVNFTAPLDREGEQTVTVRAQDASGNASEGTAKLTLKADTEPPAICGVSELVAYLGKPVSFLADVYALDDLDPAPSLTVDSSRADLKTEGEYTVIYTATDVAGNATEKEIVLKVIPESVSEEQVKEAARSVLDEILTPEMTPYEKVVAIYNWIRGNVSYREGATIYDWRQAAYQGLNSHWGDCSVFQMTSRALLTEAGIENRLIDTIPFYNVHYWNLVNVGEGWYHFDTTSFYDGQEFCYVDSATLAERSVHYKRSHSYDPERFPDLA